MGFIWNVILHFSDAELWGDDEETPSKACVPLDNVNRWLPADCRLVDLTRATFRAGAGAGMAAHVYGGGFKHFDVDSFMDVVAAQAWREPADVQVFLKSEREEQFTLHFPCGARHRQQTDQ